MSDNPEAMLLVTQEDRELRVFLLPDDEDDIERDAFLGGKRDHWPTMQAIARHRASIVPYVEALKTLRDYVSDVAGGHLAPIDASSDLRPMATEDLARIDALLSGRQPTLGPKRRCPACHVEFQEVFNVDAHLGQKPTPSETKCEHDWVYTRTDYRGSHKGEDHYDCRKCRAWKDELDGVVTSLVEPTPSEREGE